MRFSTFVLKNVFRRRIRSTLTMTGMAIAVGAVVALVGVSKSFESSLLRLYESRGVALIVSDSHQVNPLSGVMKQEVGEEIAKLDGVADCCPGLVDYITIENLGNQNVIVQGWPSWAYMFDEVKMVQGERLTEKSRGTKSVMLGRELAEKAEMKIGSTLSMVGDEYHVVGIYESTIEMENNFVVLLLEDAQKLTGKTGKITGLTVRLKDNNPASVEKIQSRIEGDVADKLHLASSLKAKPPGDFVKHNNQILAAKIFAWVTSTIAIIIGAIQMLNTMFMSVFERTREIGILRAIGWRPGRVMRMILAESMLLSVGGAVLGTLGGVGLTHLISRLPIVNGMIQGGVSGVVVLEGFIIALLVGLLGAAYPAFRGSRLLPTEALRHE